MPSPNDSSSASLVFFGAGPLAAESLKFIHKHFSVEAVFTKPRAAHHKGPVPVIDFCDKQNISYYTSTSKTELSDVFKTTKFQSNVGVVIDYGIIIEETVIDSFELGIINSHFSLLPEWRGADPITFALLSGQRETGVSLMQINTKMDEGPLLAQAKLAIGQSTDSLSLTADLIEISNALLAEILPLYQAGQIQMVPQDCTIGRTKVPSYSHKLTKQDGVIDWSKSADQIEREVRAFAAWPKSRTTIGGIDVIITKARSTDAEGSKTPGQLTVDRESISVRTASGQLQIDRLKPAGKNEMSAAEFLRGYGSRLISA